MAALADAAIVADAMARDAEAAAFDADTPRILNGSGRNPG